MKWLLLLSLAACGGKTLVIDSDTAWSGSLDGTGAIAGRGHASYEARDISPVCWTVTKTDSLGTLRAYMETSTWFGLGNDVQQVVTTTEPRGVVSGCVK